MNRVLDIVGVFLVSAVCAIGAGVQVGILRIAFLHHKPWWLLGLGGVLAAWALYAALITANYGIRMVMLRRLRNH